MPPPYRNPRVTPYLQALFCAQAYDGNGRNHSMFANEGFRLEDPFAIYTDLPFHMYVPSFFPRDRRLAEDFDWEACPKELSVGFYARGTKTTNFSNLVSDFTLFWNSMTNNNEPMDVVNENMSTILQRLDSFMETFPQLRVYGIKLKVHIAGHSLGGMVAAAAVVHLQDWAAFNNAVVVGTTFESPGLPQHYWAVAAQQNDEDSNFDVWYSKITNYLSMPNWVNMCLPHLGRVVHLDNDEVELNGTWFFQCAVSSGMRVWGWGGVLKALGLFGPEAGVCSTVRLLDVTAKLLHDTFKPAQVLSMMSWYLYMEKEVLFRKHCMPSLVDCFKNDCYGLPRPGMAVEMKSWPTYSSFQKTLKHFFQPLLTSMIPFHPDNIGVHNMFNKRELLRRKLLKMDGYEPMPAAQSFFRSIAAPEEARLERHEPNEIDGLLSCLR